MSQPKKICPDCGLPYMPWPKLLFMVAVVFGGSLLGTAIAAGAAWIIFQHHRAVGLALAPGLLLGGILSYWAFSTKFGPKKGWDYCSCASGV